MTGYRHIGSSDSSPASVEEPSSVSALSSKSEIFVKFLYVIYTTPFLMFFWAELRFDVNMPYSDDYDSVLNWLHDWISSNTLRDKIHILFRQHNAHRIVWDRLVELVELHSLGTVNFIYLDVFGAAGLFLLVIFLSRTAYKAGMPLVGVVPIPFLMLTFAQNNLLSFSMASIQIYWSILFSVVGFYFVSDSGIRWSLPKGLAFSICSAFTSAGGLIGFPAILIYYALNKKRKLAFVWACCASVVFWLYFIYFPFHQTLVATESHRYAYLHPIKCMEYIFAFLGNASLGYRPAIMLGVGLVFVVVIPILFFKKLRSSWAFLVIMFVVATAASAGFGRVALGVSQSMSSRYTVFGNLFITIVYIALFLTVSKKSHILALGYLSAVLLYFGWLFPGLASLHRIHKLHETQLVYPTQSRAYSVLKTAMHENIFLPILSVYKIMPISLPLNAHQLYYPGYRGHIDSLTITKDILKIRGWAALSSPEMRAEAVILDVGGSYYPVSYGLQREDVAKAYHNSQYLYTGYKAAVRMPVSKHKRCRVSVIVVGKNRSKFYQSPIRILNCG